MKKKGRFADLWIHDTEVRFPRIEKVREAKKRLKEREK